MCSFYRILIFIDLLEVLFLVPMWFAWFVLFLLDKILLSPTLLL